MRDRATQGPRLFTRNGFFCDPEIDQHHAILIIQQNIAGLEIAMHDGRRLRVHIGQHIAQLPHPRRELAQWNPFIGQAAAHGV